MVRREWFAF